MDQAGIKHFLIQINFSAYENGSGQVGSDDKHFLKKKKNYIYKNKCVKYNENKLYYHNNKPTFIIS